MMRNWDPWREIERLRGAVESAFDELGVRGPRAAGGFPAFLQSRSARAYPAVNVSEDADHVYVEALAPGVNPETFEVTVHHGNLRIAGEKGALCADIAPEAYHRNERPSGRFVRTVTLPAAVVGDGVTADYKDGVLCVALPKAEEAKPRQVQVRVE